MAKTKKIKYPKKPKASASVATMEKYLERVKEVDKQNQELEKEKKKREELKKKIAKI